MISIKTRNYAIRNAVFTGAGILLIFVSWIAQNYFYNKIHERLDSNIINLYQYNYDVETSYLRAIFSLLSYNHIYNGMWTQDVVMKIDQVNLGLEILYEANVRLNSNERIPSTIDIETSFAQYDTIAWKKTHEVWLKYAQNRAEAIPILISSLNASPQLADSLYNRSLLLSRNIDTAETPEGLIASVMRHEGDVYRAYVDRINSLHASKGILRIIFTILYFLGTLSIVYGIRCKYLSNQTKAEYMNATQKYLSKSSSIRINRLCSRSYSKRLNRAFYRSKSHRRY